MPSKHSIIIMVVIFIIIKIIFVFLTCKMAIKAAEGEAARERRLLRARASTSWIRERTT